MTCSFYRMFQSVQHRAIMNYKLMIKRDK